MSSVRGLEKRSICFSVSVEEWGLWEINDGSVLFSLLLKETMVVIVDSGGSGGEEGDSGIYIYIGMDYRK